MAESRLDLLARLLTTLERYSREVTREQLESDLDTWLKVSRALELAAQCCIDLAMILVARRGFGVPDTYREAFGRLAQAGILTSEQAGVLESWAGLRNVLAHVYTAVDLDRLYATLVGDLSALKEFGKIAAREIDRT